MDYPQSIVSNQKEEYQFRLYMAKFPDKKGKVLFPNCWKKGTKKIEICLALKEKMNSNSNFFFFQKYPFKDW